MGKNAGDFSLVYQDIVGPTQVASELGGLLNGLGSGKTEKKAGDGQIDGRKADAQKDRAVDTDVARGDPTSSQAADARGLLFCEHYGSVRSAR